MHPLWGLCVMANCLRRGTEPVTVRFGASERQVGMCERHAARR